MKKYPLTIISFLLFFSFGCSSTVQEIDGKQYKNGKLYPNSGDNLLKNQKVKIIEKDSFYIYDSKYFSLHLPYSWTTYLEPKVKEQIRHSPYKTNEKVINSDFYVIFYAEETVIEAEKFLKKKLNRIKALRGSSHGKIRAIKNNHIGDYWVIESFYGDVSTNKIIINYYPMDKKYMSIVIGGKKVLFNKHMATVNKMIESIKLK